MSDRDLFQTILKTSFTRGDLLHSIALLRQYLEWKFFTNKTSSQTIQDFAPQKQIEEDDAKTLASWGDDFFKTFNRTNLYNLLNSISESAGKLPVLTLFLPYQVTELEKASLGKWLRKAVVQDLLLDVRQDSSLVGGCAIIWKGIYRQYSARYFMEKKRDEIKNLIAYYVRKYPQG